MSGHLNKSCDNQSFFMLFERKARYKSGQRKSRQEMNEKEPNDSKYVWRV